MSGMEVGVGGHIHIQLIDYVVEQKLHNIGKQLYSNKKLLKTKYIYTYTYIYTYIHIHTHILAIHSRILALRIPWTEEPGGLQSMGSQRVGHD